MIYNINRKSYAKLKRNIIESAKEYIQIGIDVNQIIPSYEELKSANVKISTAPTGFLLYNEYKVFMDSHEDLYNVGDKIDFSKYSSIYLIMPRMEGKFAVRGFGKQMFKDDLVNKIRENLIDDDFIAKYISLHIQDGHGLVSIPFDNDKKSNNLLDAFRQKQIEGKLYCGSEYSAPFYIEVTDSIGKTKVYTNPLLTDVDLSKYQVKFTFRTNDGII